MEGVTTAIVLFIFFCIGFPHLIRRRAQYYAAVASILLLLLLGCIDGIVSADSRYHGFFHVMMYLLDFCAMLLLIMSTGGLTAGELAGQMRNAFDEVRRGPKTDLPVVVPITGAMPTSSRRAATDRADEVERTRYTIEPTGVDVPSDSGERSAGE